MAYYLIKLAITSVLVVVVSEVAKRSALLGGFLASIPLVSLLAMVWLYLETRDEERVAALAASIFWLVLPSLVLFVALPFFLRHGMGFFAALGIGLGLTLCAYLLMWLLLRKAGIAF